MFEQNKLAHEELFDDWAYTTIAPWYKYVIFGQATHIFHKKTGFKYVDVSCFIAFVCVDTSCLYP